MEKLIKEYKLKFSVSQDKDGAAKGDDCNVLKIFSEDCGGGLYFILKTDRWAFDNPEELIDLINEFMKVHDCIQSKTKKY